MALLVGMVCSLQAQVRRGGYPIFCHSDMWNGENVRTTQIELQPMDRDIYLQQDMDGVKGASPLRMGITQKVDVDFDAPAFSTIPAYKVRQEVVYKVCISSPGATFQCLYFDRFLLSRGCSMYLYDETGDCVLGSFTRENMLPDGSFYTQAVPGSRCYIEWHFRDSIPAQHDVHLQYVVRGYKDMYGDNFSVDEAVSTPTKDHIGYSQGDCHIDVACSQGDAWRDEIRSVVEILTLTTAGSYLCSGALVNNTAQDHAPYVLSAYHCQDLADSLLGHVFYFNYQASACGLDDAPITHSVIGGTTLAKYGASDFWLVRLDEPIPDEYQPYYAGWTRVAQATPSVGCAIHHPGGDIKKISFPWRIVAQGGYYANFYRTDWDPSTKGVVEQGSSGSPLFDGDHLIVGQLWAAFGSVSCSDASGYSMWGRVGASWYGGGTADTRLSDWLDPLYSGVNYLTGADYDEAPHRASSTSTETTLFVYPNPSNGMVHIDVPLIGEASYLVRDVWGRVVMEGKTIVAISSHALNLTMLHQGVYIVELTMDGVTFSNIVVIEK